jgi:outer membrane lipoprotein-sorting protein
MRFLRTAPTRRLLALIAGVVAIIAAGTAIAIAATGSGPVPPAKPLASAVHGALGAPQVKGISARISFTNHLIDSSSLQGADPILSGASGRLWLAPHRLRLELQSSNGNGQDAQVVVSDGAFWVYDPASNTVYRGKLPSDGTSANKASKSDRLPSIAEIQSDLNRLARRVNLTGAIPGDVAGQAAYTVRVSPKHDAGMLGAAELAWDATRGVPLRFAIYARGQSSPVIELKATDISYGTVAASDFSVSPPSGAKIVNVTVPAGGHAAREHARGHGRHREVSGAAAVAKRLPFTLVAPQKLVGLPRRSVSLLDWNGSPGALVTYGQNLGGIAVIEQPAQANAAGKAQGGDRSGLSLPSVSINGATGQELDTALGSVVRFTRNGVSYTVLGSVPAAAADAAARAL